MFLTLYGEIVLFHLTVRIIPTHRKYRHNWPVLVHGTAIYAVKKDILSRPIIGHTPRKLPALTAISRIIAVLTVNPLKS